MNKTKSGNFKLNTDDNVFSTLGEVRITETRRHRETSLVDGRIEVTYELIEQAETWPAKSRRVVKKVFRAKGDKIVLDETIHGKIIPERVIPEQIEWEEE